MKSNEVAVLMSLYKGDRLKFVIQSIQSILEQTYVDFDLYIYIDGVVDKPVYDYVNSLDDSRINILVSSFNSGLAFAMNSLLRIIRDRGYKYFFRMDADDIALPNRFEKQIAFMESNVDIDCAGCWAVEIQEDGSDFFLKRMPQNHDQCLALFRRRDCVIHPSVIFRYTYFEKVPFYPEDTYFGEDTMMWAMGFKAGCRFANLPECLLKFRLDRNFFQRRRGWKHAKSILVLRMRVNKMLEFGLKENLYAILYAIAKMMPTRLLSIIYRKLR
ncbi:glycosyltransferase [Bacteroides fluxus]|uniref:Glycosyltransferase, group 2 family protein n=1 Tax=Bacteroides fluxus YIT 12057 TaxID=763034 RepID=F3PXK5_9BACE|nr:glycosyltransferase [Bacteroides fluxus]EGF51587.1 glycosyltransferase, group 2 family protein [Bacteroides fluxus YIT 12057]